MEKFRIGVTTSFAILDLSAVTSVVMVLTSEIDNIIVRHYLILKKCIQYSSKNNKCNFLKVLRLD